MNTTAPKEETPGKPKPAAALATLVAAEAQLAEALKARNTANIAARALGLTEQTYIVPYSGKSYSVEVSGAGLKVCELVKPE